MKALTISFISIFLLCTSVSAKKIKGYIIDKEGNKTEVVFKEKFDFWTGGPNYANVQNSINYLEGKTVKTLYPWDCQRIGFILSGETVELLSIKNVYKKETKNPADYLFLRPKMNGTITLYYYYYNETHIINSPTGGSSNNRMYNGWILQHTDGPFMYIKHGRGENEDYLRVFFDYPEIENILDTKRIKSITVTELVTEYNKFMNDLSIGNNELPINDTLSN